MPPYFHGFRILWLSKFHLCLLFTFSLKWNKIKQAWNSREMKLRGISRSLLISFLPEHIPPCFHSPLISYLKGCTVLVSLSQTSAILLQCIPDLECEETILYLFSYQCPLRLDGNLILGVFKIIFSFSRGMFLYELHSTIRYTRIRSFCGIPLYLFFSDW